MINVNLLPPEIKEEIAQSKRNKTASRYLRLTLMVLLILVGINIANFIYLDGQLKNARTTLSQKDASLTQYIPIENNSKKLSERINNIKQITGKTNIWSGTIDEITSIMPKGVYLTNITIDSVIKNRAKITGNALSKTEVSAFSEAMKHSLKFKFVDIQSSNTAYDHVKKREIENFVISFSLSEGALR